MCLITFAQSLATLNFRRARSEASANPSLHATDSIRSASVTPSRTIAEAPTKCPASSLAVATALSCCCWAKRKPQKKKPRSPVELPIARTHPSWTQKPPSSWRQSGLRSWLTSSWLRLALEQQVCNPASLWSGVCLCFFVGAAVPEMLPSNRLKPVRNGRTDRSFSQWPMKNSSLKTLYSGKIIRISVGRGTL